MLGAAFGRKPSEEWLRRLAHDLECYLAQAADLESGLRDIIREVHAGLSAPLIALEQDYQRLIGGAGRLLAPPWESVWASPERLVMQQAEQQVRQAYQEAGFTFDGMGRLPADHISLECEFVAALLLQAAEALETGEEDRSQSLLERKSSFLENHLAAWAPLFAKTIEEQAQTSYWRGLGRLLSALVEADLARCLTGQASAPCLGIPADGAS